MTPRVTTERARALLGPAFRGILTADERALAETVIALHSERTHALAHLADEGITAPEGTPDSDVLAAACLAAAQEIDRLRADYTSVSHDLAWERGVAVPDLNHQIGRLTAQRDALAAVVLRVAEVCDLARKASGEPDVDFDDYVVYHLVTQLDRVERGGWQAKAAALRALVSTDPDAPPPADVRLLAAANRTLAAELAEARELAEKYRIAASVLCGAHIGVPQAACPVCERDELRAELAAERGEAEGALPGWLAIVRLRQSCVVWSRIPERTDGEDHDASLRVEPSGGRWAWRVRGWTGLTVDVGDADTAHDAMRAAEASATERIGARFGGLLPTAPADGGGA